VLYMGTFSKVLFPSVRLAYLVAPHDLVDAFVAARTLADGHSPQLMQAVVADFIAEGHFAAHLRRMRMFYAERRELFLQAVSEEVGGKLRLGPSTAGLQVAAYLGDGSDDRAVAQRGAREGLSLEPLSRFYCGAATVGLSLVPGVVPEARPRPAAGLLLGYAGLAPDAARQGLRELARLL
jgi:GntR family transcriptional regulator / MocR family aminotransferase